MRRISAAAAAVTARRLGVKCASRQRVLMQFLGVLADFGDFPWGGRVAYPVEAIARDLHCNHRTARTLVKQLSELGELVTVHWVPRGELAYDGQATRRAHYEFSMGRVLRSHAHEVLGAVQPLLSDEPSSQTPHARAEAWGANRAETSAPKGVTKQASGALPEETQSAENTENSAGRERRARGGLRPPDYVQTNSGAQRPDSRTVEPPASEAKNSKFSSGSAGSSAASSAAHSPLPRLEPAARAKPAAPAAPPNCAREATRAARPALSQTELPEEGAEPRESGQRVALYDRAIQMAPKACGRLVARSSPPLPLRAATPPATLPATPPATEAPPLPPCTDEELLAELDTEFLNSPLKPHVSLVEGGSTPSAAPKLPTAVGETARRPDPSPKLKAVPGPPRAPVPASVQAVIEQHRKIAEGKGPGVPISLAEGAMVEAARASQCRMDDSKWLGFCGNISRIAFERSDQPTASLGYTFGQFFAHHVAVFREECQAQRKRAYAAEARAAARRRGRAESEEQARLRAASVERAEGRLSEAMDYAQPEYRPVSSLRPGPALANLHALVPPFEKPRPQTASTAPQRPAAEPPTGPPQARVSPPAETDPELIRIFEETRNKLEISGYMAKRAGDSPEQPPPQAAPEPPQEPPRPEPKPEPQEVPEPPEKALEPQPAPPAPPKTQMEAWKQLPPDQYRQERRKLDSLSLEDRIKALNAFLA